MPPPTSSQKPGIKAAATNGNGNGKAPAHDEEHVGGKPDQAKYNAEQDAVNKEIAAVKAKLVSDFGGL